MVPFTYVSGLIFIFYLITNNPYIESVSLNCAIGVLFGFKSAILIDNEGYKKCVGQSISINRITPRQFVGMDILMHGSPVVYFLFNKSLYNIKYLNQALITSVSIHVVWAILTCRGLNLNKIYLDKCDYQLCDRQWHKMWICTLIGHSVPHILYVIMK
jgi:hypothetical protein